LSSGGAGGALRLLGLLLRLGSSLLLLALFDSLRAGGGTGLGALAAALLDYVEGGSDDGTLVLDGAASAFLGNFLYSRSRQPLWSVDISNHDSGKNPNMAEQWTLGP
jgi:hypothetical protein